MTLNKERYFRQKCNAVYTLILFNFKVIKRAMNNFIEVVSKVIIYHYLLQIRMNLVRKQNMSVRKMILHNFQKKLC
jgi:hypothetical protein